VTGSGPGSVILSNGDINCFNFTSTTDCSIENLWFASISASAAVNGNFSSRLRVRECDFNTCLMGLQFGGTALDPWVSHTRVKASTTTSGFQGAVYLANSQRPKLEFVDVTDSAGNGYFITDSPDLTIIGGEVSRNGGTTAGKRGINFGTGGTTPRPKISWLHMDTNAEQAVYCSTNVVDGKLAHCVMSNHNGANAADSGTIEIGSTGWSVQDVDIENSGGSLGNPNAVFLGAAEGSLKHLRVRNSNGRGITLWGANDGLVEGCRVKNSGLSVANSAIFISNGSLRPIVSGNRCYDDQGVPTQTYGLEVSGSVDRLLWDGAAVATSTSLSLVPPHGKGT
jgi:hypothetical protein